MRQKYLLRRGRTYYFRWRVPDDLRSIVGVTEVRQSLRTSDQWRALGRAGRLVAAVAGIQEARGAHLVAEIDTAGYDDAVRQQLGILTAVTQGRKKTHKTGLITVGDVRIDYDGDAEKEIAAARALGLDLSAQAATTANGSSSMPFSELYSEFIRHKAKEGLSERIRKEYARYYGGLIEIMGDLLIGEISRKVLRNAILTFRSLPKRNKNPYRGQPLLDLLEIEIPESDRIADKTVIEVRKMVQGIFRYAVEHELLSQSPARDLSLKLDSSRTFAPYTDGDVRRILAAALKETESWKRWLPMLAAFTGARRGELVQLRKQDVKLDSDSGRHYLLITEDAGSVKTSNAVRQVPLHWDLINNGFLDFADAAGERLFGELDPQAVTKWFAAFRDGLGIERFDDFGNRRTFHSFRHGFVTKSRGAGNPLDHVQQCVGHEKIKTGVTDRYTHRLPLREVLRVVDCVAY